MSVLNWILDLDQESKIIELTEERDKLQKRVEVIEGWIRYLDEKVKTLEQQLKDK